MLYTLKAHVKEQNCFLLVMESGSKEILDTVAATLLTQFDVQPKGTVDTIDLYLVEDENGNGVSMFASEATLEQYL